MFSLAGLVAWLPALAATSTLGSTWQIVAQTPDTAIRTARSGEELWHQPLVAAQVATLDADVVDRNNKIILAAGSTMMKMAAGDATVFCDLAPRKASVAERMLIGGLGETATCLVDRDHRGRFDARFTKKVQFEGIPIIRGGYPDMPEAIVPVAYTSSDKPGAGSDYIVGINFFGRGVLDGPLNFQIVFGRPGRTSALTDLVQVSAVHMPATLSVLGSTVTLLSYSKAGGLEYRVDGTMPAQPFSVSRSFKYR